MWHRYASPHPAGLDGRLAGKLGTSGGRVGQISNVNDIGF